MHTRTYIQTFEQHTEPTQEASNSTDWWSALQPDEQQEMVAKYFPNNNFGAMGVDQVEIAKMFREEHK